MITIPDKKKFGLISEIDSSKPSTWENKIFLTFDIDWAHDEVVKETISLLNEKNIKATWFITHESPILEELKINKNFELGIHPNFNNLLNGDSENKNSEKIITELKNIVPDAKSLRSHSLTQSERLLDLFSEYGFTHICNTFIPNTVDFKIAPWKMWNKIEIIPHSWQDNVSFKIPLNDEPLIEQSLVVYNFHPIHVFLNSDSSEKYESTREFHQYPEKLKKCVNRSDGIKNFFYGIIK